MISEQSRKTVKGIVCLLCRGIERECEQRINRKISFFFGTVEAWRCEKIEFLRTSEEAIGAAHVHIFPSKPKKLPPSRSSDEHAPAHSTLTDHTFKPPTKQKSFLVRVVVGVLEAQFSTAGGGWRIEFLRLRFAKLSGDGINHLEHQFLLQRGLIFHQMCHLHLAMHSFGQPLTSTMLLNSMS
ncbi:hypothetical protein YC2023_061317 [Brassica napus]